MPESWNEGLCYNRRFKFRFADCDCNKHANLYTIMKLLSEIAGEDYEGRGLGHGVLLEKNQAFLLSRLSLRFFRFPEYYEDTVASTWERGSSGPFFLRDFEIRAAGDSLLAAAASQWLLIDTQTREILRPADIYGGLKEGEPRRADCSECAKLRKLASPTFLGSRPVYYSDLDSNGHVNNAVYGKIAVDFVPREMRKRKLLRFDINFNMETRLGETLEMFGSETDNSYEINGYVDGTLHFSCRFFLDSSR